MVEAMAAGKPVVCFDLGGPGLHINPDCGFKVPAGTPEQAVQDMTEALGRLASDPELRVRMGRAAFERARQVYDWDRVAERIVEAYRETIPCRRQDPGEVPTSTHKLPAEGPTEILPLALRSSR